MSKPFPGESRGRQNEGTGRHVSVPQENTIMACEGERTRSDSEQRAYNLVRSKALIVGLYSQDGQHLCRLLLKKGYEVWGTTRKISRNNNDKDENLKAASVLEMDLLDDVSIASVLRKMKTMLNGDEQLEVYCLAAVSQVSKGISEPVESANVNALGPIRLLKNIVEHDLTDRVRCFFAASSEIYGNETKISPQCEETPCIPTSPYGMAKFFMVKQVKFYREYYGVFACSGILYNHESEIRPASFVTRKITLTASAISKGLMSQLEIGDLNAERDWGHAEDFVNGMWLMLQADKAEEYILCTGKLRSVRELVSVAFSIVGIDLRWEGTGVKEVGINIATDAVVVRVNPTFYKPNEEKYRELTKVKPLVQIVGNCTKASEKLGWRRKFNFEDTIKSMLLSDLSLCDEDISRELGIKVDGSSMCHAEVRQELSRIISSDSHPKEPFHPGSRLNTRFFQNKLIMCT